MSTYAVGDVQGCLAELEALLERIDFCAGRDRLVFVGDLVNRGPDSLGVLRKVRGLGDAAVCVLGNHDLHLIAVAHGARRLRRDDTFADVLEAPDGRVLVEWLRHLPLIHRERAHGFTVVHAGLPPQWSVEQAERLAHEVQDVLRGPGAAALLADMYGDGPERWSETLAGTARLRFIVNACTRLRFCDAAGRLALGETGPPGTQPPPYLPWFAVPGRRSAGERIAFGHWSTLRLDAAEQARHKVYPLDTSCVWGGELTAMRLEDLATFSVPAQTERRLRG